MCNIKKESRERVKSTVIVVSVDDKMIIKLHNWIYFLTAIMTIIEGNCWLILPYFVISFVVLALNYTFRWLLLFNDGKWWEDRRILLLYFWRRVIPPSKRRNFIITITLIPSLSFSLMAINYRRSDTNLYNLKLNVRKIGPRWTLFHSLYDIIVVVVFPEIKKI